MNPKLPDEIQAVLKKGLLKRLPRTFLPFVNQHLREWEFLFPHERETVQRMLTYLGGLDKERLSELFRDIRDLEARMGVAHWEFSTKEQTIENASLLARSAYYLDWRREVQRIFDHVEEHAMTTEERKRDESKRRLVLLLFPERLPLDASRVWNNWQGFGKPVKLEMTRGGEKRSAFESLLGQENAAESGRTGSLAAALEKRLSQSRADVWVVDAGGSLVEPLLKTRPERADSGVATLLSYDRLAAYRENFSHEMNQMRKDLADADAIYARLRKVDVVGWCPPEVASQPLIREFLRSLFLDGNGAILFGNSFVEWASSESFRRARPSVLVGQFGIRNKPKPFTSVAVFENPEQINPLPPVEDLSGSALDAQMLAFYVWLAAGRHPEYRRQTLCICLAENLSEAYVVAPSDAPIWLEKEPIKLDRLGSILGAWLS